MGLSNRGFRSVEEGEGSKLVFAEFYGNSWRILRIKLSSNLVVNNFEPSRISLIEHPLVYQRP